MKIYIATDHAGFEMKNYLVHNLRKFRHKVEDFGASSFQMGDDYTAYVSKVAEKVAGDCTSVIAARIASGVASDTHSYCQAPSMGIVLGGSGTGEAIVANRYPNVRAFAYSGQDRELIELSRIHNDCNVLSLGARFLKFEQALEAVLFWLGTTFGSEERHVRRLDQIEKLRLGNSTLL